MSSVKVSGNWRNIEAPYVKVGGSWNVAQSAFIKVSGEWKSWFALALGFLDTTFTSTISGDKETTIWGIAIQPDRKILIGGTFTTISGTTVNSIARLNANGTLDTAFTTNIGTGADDWVYGVALQPDGKILVGGRFSAFNGTTTGVSGSIIRLNADGTLDTAFTTNGGTGVNNDVFDAVLQPDGKIVICGVFTTFNGTTVNRIARLNADGTLDTAFTTNTGTGANGIGRCLALQPDGKILVGGDFSTFNGTTTGVSGSIIRLNSNGTLDTAFTTNGGTGVTNDVDAVAVQPDGKVLIGGSFTTFNGTVNNGLFRLNSDGSLDTAFTTNGGTGPSNNVNTVALQPDGKVLIGGEFSAFNGTARDGIFRLNSDGSLDTAFSTNGGTSALNNPAQKVALQPDGKILIGGNFTEFGGTTANFLVRLQ